MPYAPDEASDHCMYVCMYDLKILKIMKDSSSKIIAVIFYIVYLITKVALTVKIRTKVTFDR